jgi:hypothetical protein
MFKPGTAAWMELRPEVELFEGVLDARVVLVALGRAAQSGTPSLCGIHGERDVAATLALAACGSFPH